MITAISNRIELFSDLHKTLIKQVTPEVEILTACDYESTDTDRVSRGGGAKRNNLLKAATGDYVVWIDDDDLVPDYFVAEILKAIESKPDCVGYWNECHLTEGGKTTIRLAKHSNSVDEWGEEDKIYLRSITFLNPVRRDIAIKFPFDGTYTADYEQSKLMKPYLHKEVFIDKVMYIYYPVGSRQL